MIRRLVVKEMHKTFRLWRIAAAVVLAVSVCFCTSCGQQSEDSDEESSAGYEVYMANSEGTGLDSDYYEVSEQEPDDIVNKLYRFMSTYGENGPSGIYAELSRRPEFSIVDRVLYVDLPENYNSMSNVNQVLLRASVVKTMVQVEGIDYVTFYIDNMPLTQSMALSNDVNTSVGATLLNEASFVDSAMNAMDVVERLETTLYYADESGQKLVGEKDYISYNKNSSIEQVIIEQLIKGPEHSECKATLPKNLKLLSVSTKDGVCYVNFDSTFMDSMADVTAQVTIYSVVNSLCEIDGVKKVQFLVNGSQEGSYREQYPLSAAYERDLDLVTMTYIN